MLFSRFQKHTNIGRSDTSERISGAADLRANAGTLTQGSEKNEHLIITAAPSADVDVSTDLEIRMTAPLLPRAFARQLLFLEPRPSRVDSRTVTRSREIPTQQTLTRVAGLCLAGLGPGRSLSNIRGIALAGGNPDKLSGKEQTFARASLLRFYVTSSLSSAVHRRIA